VPSRHEPGGSIYETGTRLGTGKELGVQFSCGPSSTPGLPLDDLNEWTKKAKITGRTV